MKIEDFDILILGAGASGLMVAALLKDKKRVALIEKNSKVGAKLLVSGGSRCNITNQNLSYKNYLSSDYEFVKKTIKRFNQDRLIKWLKFQGVELSLEKGSQLFCKSGSKSVVNLFKRLISSSNLFLNQEIISLEYKKDRFLLTINRAKFRAKAVVVATGGLSFAKLGATGVGFEIAKSFGHSITKLSPALVGLTLQKEHFFFRNLSGVSTKVVAKVKDKTFKDNILFTHKGVSGPAILNSSLYWDRGLIEIDFLPNFSLQKSKKSLSNSLPLPKSLSKALLKHLNIQDKPSNLLSQSEIERLKLLNSFKLSPSGTFGFSKAEVTKGGVAVSEIDSNMMSKLQRGLFFVGEVLDVTGELGGYNLQWAFSSAYVCAKYLNSHLL